ncbi:MAG: hypothetical protein ACOH1R_07310 [Luteimonas sp.]
MSKPIPSFAHLQTPLPHPQQLPSSGAILIAGQIRQQGQMKFQRFQAPGDANEIVMDDGEVRPNDAATPLTPGP